MAKEWPTAGSRRSSQRDLSRGGEARAAEGHDGVVIIAGLVPSLWSHGTGADVMKCIATPMIGGIVTSTLMKLLVDSAIFATRDNPG